MDEACLPVPSTKKHASRRNFSPCGGVRNVPTCFLILGGSHLAIRASPESQGSGILLRPALRDLRLSLDPLLLKRFSLLPFPLLDDPQPPKTNGEDHHDDQNGILYHWSALS
jgi:hypothetical protein